MTPSLRILTFDIEEWFNLLDTDTGRMLSDWNTYECRIHENTDRILELLKKTKSKASFFCLGWIAKRYPEIIKKIDESGFEIGSHTTTHQLAYEQTPEQFREDVQKSINLLQDITGKAVRSFRVPGFSITKENTWTLPILAECGITVDSSIFPARRGHCGFSEFGFTQPVTIATDHGSIREFPINTVSLLGKHLIYSGGGYFRLFPYLLLKHFFRNDPYIMTYFHPRDFDSTQPVLKGLPLVRRFKSYVGLSTSLKKLEKMLTNYSFTDIKGAEASIDWTTAPVVDL
jgi:peptidoglycan-N-acetylglucosamine deacetylase